MHPHIHGTLLRAPEDSPDYQSGALTVQPRLQKFTGPLRPQKLGGVQYLGVYIVPPLVVLPYAIGTHQLAENGLYRLARLCRSKRESASDKNVCDLA